MIVTFLLTMAADFLTGLISILPSSTGLPSGISSALTYMIGAINSMSYIINVSALFGALVVVVGFEAGLWAIHAVQWIYKRIPFLGR
jgi:hypothetical protein